MFDSIISSYVLINSCIYRMQYCRTSVIQPAWFPVRLQQNRLQTGRYYLSRLLVQSLTTYTFDERCNS